MLLLTILEGAGFIAGTAALTLLCYFAMRRLAGVDPEQTTKDLRSSVIFRVSTLHGLILALVFAQEMVEYQQLKNPYTHDVHAFPDARFYAGQQGAVETGSYQRLIEQIARS
ncbi:hypothetical protein [uncultured Hoeflea sp.]|uniref:hypothetical protein n=1 Tax=uncultured Hoeflea sp. TaxID=538666 RepID=UPI0030DB0875|tara:strand:- start:4799 stop:5134 length:336 start_codon:yes stop_codon:yes gene_type:complete